jgi:hypothetical protein
VEALHHLLDLAGLLQFKQDLLLRAPMPGLDRVLPSPGGVGQHPLFVPRVQLGQLASAVAALDWQAEGRDGVVDVGLLWDDVGVGDEEGELAWHEDILSVGVGW